MHLTGTSENGRWRVTCTNKTSRGFLFCSLLDNCPRPFRHMHSHRFSFRIFCLRFGSSKAITSLIPWTAHSVVCAITVSYTWQRPASEATANSASQKILSLLCNLKVHHRAQDSPTLVPIINQINPITTFQPNPIKATRNIIESTTISFKLQHIFKFPQPKFLAFPITVICAFNMRALQTIVKIKHHEAPHYVLFSVFKTKYLAAASRQNSHNNWSILNVETNSIELWQQHTKEVM
jgi:hypothetical protein